MVDKINALYILNILGIVLITTFLLQSRGSSDWIIISIIAVLILILLNYLILRGAGKLVNSIQYKSKKILICPKCYTKVEKKEGTFCPNCGNKI